MSPVRVLGACGLVSALFCTLSGLLQIQLLLGIAGAVMLVGNVYALARGGR